MARLTNMVMIPMSHTHSVLLFSPVHFRYTVFRPVIDEILVGKVKSCSKEGISGE